MDNISLQQPINCILLLKYRYLGSFPPAYVSILPIETFAFISTQTSKMVGPLDIDCKLSSEIKFCRIHQSAQFLQASARAEYAKTTTISPQRLRFLRDICSFSSLQSPTRRNIWSSRCQGIFIYK